MSQTQYNSKNVICIRRFRSNRVYVSILPFTKCSISLTTAFKLRYENYKNRAVTGKPRDATVKFRSIRSVQAVVFV